MTPFPLSISTFSPSSAAVILGRNLTEAPLSTVVPPSSPLREHLWAKKQYLILRHADHCDFFTHEKGHPGVGPTSSCTT